ncbi:MAG: hypothetical protein M0R32_09900 [Candidatus Cloacimonetes bacterium]|jgi:hypothetical protein|nr:hypothetical protein [Candidatus Cloacimonadota bacterium]
MSTFYVDLVGGTDTDATKSITGATNANPCVITSASHNYAAGQVIYLSGLAGITQLNNQYYTVANPSPNTYELLGIDTTSGYGIYTSGGISKITGKLIEGATQANPCVITCTVHEFLDDDYVFINDVTGMTELNGRSFKVANKTADTFELSGVDSSGYSAFSSGGDVRRAYLTTQVAIDQNIGSDEVRISKTEAYTQYTSADLTWTRGSRIVTTSSSLVGSFAVGDLIGRDGAAGDGNFETFYRVNGITATTITLGADYYGTTGVDTASVWKVIPFTAGINGQRIIYPLNPVTVSGGWNLETSERDGETWLKHFSRTTSSNIGIYGSENCIYSHLNIVECYMAVSCSGSQTFSNCSFMGYVYTIYLSGELHTLTDCVGMGSGGTSWPTMHNLSNIFCTDCLFLAFTGGRASSCTTGGTTNGGFYFGGSYGVYGSSDISIENATFENNAYGVTGFNNIKVYNCNFINCTYGVRSGSPSISYLIDNCNFSGCDCGFYGTQVNGVIIENSTFTSNLIDIYGDIYTGKIYSYNNVHLTPSNWAYSRTLSTGTMQISNCTIDAPSIAKAFQIIAGSSYAIPQYILQNSFGYCGSYYANGQLTKDSTVFRTAGPSLKFSYNSTKLYNWFDIKMVACYAKSLQSKTFSLYMKRDTTAFTGTIVPSFKLNGARLTTESTITTLTDSWVLYEWTCDGSLITVDGELSLEFSINGNNTAIWIDDFTVTDV